MENVNLNETESQSQYKPILDPCCGSRMFYFDKDNQNVVFGDIRQFEDTLCDGRVLKIYPDIQMDFRDIPFDDNSFYLVVFDPPHLLKVGQNSWLAKKYGKLSNNWGQELKQGFDECIRVLKPFGTLVFKWNETDLTVNQIIKVIGYKPIFGHKSGKLAKTHWLCFMKGVSDEI